MADRGFKLDFSFCRLVRPLPRNFCASKAGMIRAARVGRIVEGDGRRDIEFLALLLSLTVVGGVDACGSSETSLASASGRIRTSRRAEEVLVRLAGTCVKLCHGWCLAISRLPNAEVPARRRRHLFRRLYRDRRSGVPARSLALGLLVSSGAESSEQANRRVALLLCRLLGRERSVSGQPEIEILSRDRPSASPP